jgi:hypothetical protein
MRFNRPNVLCAGRKVTHENTGLQSGFENGMLKPGKTQNVPRYERIQICVSGVRPAHEV